MSEWMEKANEGSFCQQKVFLHTHTQNGNVHMKE